MKITQFRYTQSGGATTSIRFIDGVFCCYILEDEHHPVKIPGKTRIPAGTYPLRLKTDGSKHEEYKKKFPSFHVGMIEICNVPNYVAVLDHIGNKKEDTEGCNLTGEISDPKLGIVQRSSAAYQEYYKKVAPAIKAGVNVTLTIYDEVFFKGEKK